ncbi:MAG: fatty acyl-AMP ligase [Anaerolineae bacterium]|nr:fatty acyl-AMP ligase [Anaerolineae bacterium]
MNTAPSFAPDQPETWNLKPETPGGPSPHEAATLPGILRWRARHQPDKLGFTFLEDGETQESPLTFGQLDHQARAVAAQLQSLGVAGERALLLFPPGLDYIIAFFACLYAEVVAVPAYPPDPVRLERTLPRLLGIVNDARPALVLTTADIVTMVPYLLEAYPDLRGIRWLATDEVAPTMAEAWREPALGPDRLAFLQYTSGSTAEPRGVMLTHGHLMYNSEMIHQALETDEDTRCVFWLPFYHDMGLIGAILGTVYCGAFTVLMSPLHFLQRPLRWLQAVSRYQATISGSPNFGYDLCVRKVTPEQRATLDLSHWQLAFSGAEPVRHETLQRFAEAFAPCGFRQEALYPGYGLAEATLFVSGGRREDPPVFLAVNTAMLAQGRVVVAAPEEEGAQTLVGCGRAWLDEEVLIVDPETRTPCPPDRMGEIWVKSPSVALGYWQRPEESERTFRACLADGTGPYLRTGDLGFLREGELFITGRLKDMIIIDGLNHYPQDIELTVEQSHLALRPGCSAAFSVDVGNQERLVIVAEVQRSKQLAELREQGLTVTPEELTRAIRQAVAQRHDLRVHDIVLLQAGSVPKTSSGKIQRRAARAAYLAGTMDVWQG